MQQWIACQNVTGRGEPVRQLWKGFTKRARATELVAVPSPEKRETHTPEWLLAKNAERCITSPKNLKTFSLTQTQTQARTEIIQIVFLWVGRLRFYWGGAWELSSKAIRSFRAHAGVLQHWTARDEMTCFRINKMAATNRKMESLPPPKWQHSNLMLKKSDWIERVVMSWWCPMGYEKWHFNGQNGVRFIPKFSSVPTVGEVWSYRSNFGFKNISV